MVGAGPNGGHQLSPGSKMKCYSSPTRDPDPISSPCPRSSRSALAGPRAKSFTQQSPAEATATIRSPCFLGTRPQPYTAKALAGR